MKSNKGLWAAVFVLAILLALSVGFIAGIFFPGRKADETPVSQNAAPETAATDANTDASAGDPKETETASEAPAAVSSETEQKDQKSSGKFTGRETYGALSVKDGKLVGQNGEPAVLRGISTHGLSWYPQYVNEASFRSLKEEYGINVIRLAMYTAEYNGYCTGDDANKQTLKNLITEGINHATNLGMYVIVDWHILSDSNPLQNKDQAKSFFAEISSQYQNYDNIIYEICNEPNGGTTWQDIKSYAGEVIPIIRSNDKDAIILVGTPNWSQFLNEAADDPISGDNIMYTLHFYAATHKDDLRNTLKSALDRKLPVFVSEFGICEASGSGNLDKDSANTWIDLLEKNQISYVLWNLSNKDEACALLKPDCQKTSDFTKDDLSEQGKWYVDILKKYQ